MKRRGRPPKIVKKEGTTTLFGVGTTHWSIPFFINGGDRLGRDRPVDKRLDEWIGGERFVSNSQLEEEEALKRGAEEEGRFPENSSIQTEPEKEKEPSKSTTSEQKNTRVTRSRLERNNNSLRPTSPIVVDPAYAELEREHEEATKVKNIQKIILGRYEIDCWYFSPYPDEYAENVNRLYICEKCLKYIKNEVTYNAHYHNCDYTGPPGKLLYLKDGLAIFELEGESAKLYCQNLCLLAKLFLDHKTLYYDVAHFIFYVLCEVEADGTHPVGYFSKEKVSPDDYNLACIMILPPYQKRGYGRFLIQLSYEITRREGKTGSPEKPLSDLGRLSYSSFWSYELLMRLKNGPRVVPSIAELSRQTAFKQEDIIETLSDLGLLRNYRGQKILNMAPKLLDTLLEPFKAKKFTLLEPDCLNWP